MKNNFSLNDGIVKKSFFASFEISIFSRRKFKKTIRVIIKSLIYAVAT